MDNQGDFEINLFKLFRRLLNRFPIAVLAAFIFAIAAFFYYKTPIKTTYTAQASFYVESNLSSDENQLTLTDDNLTYYSSSQEGNPSLKTVCYVATARTSLEAVINLESLPYSVDELSRMVSVSSLDNVSAFSVRVRSSSEYEALRIAHAFANALPEELSSISPSIELRVLDFGSVTKEYSGGYFFKKSALVGFIAGILALCVIAAKYVLDEISGKVEINAADLKTLYPKIRCLSLSSKKGFDAEASNRLRTNLLLSFPDDATQRVIGVTAPSNGVGKDAFTVQIASSLADLGKKVLLIDADMHFPALHSIINCSCENGLSDLLDSSESPFTFIRKCSLETGAEFSLLCAGGEAAQRADKSDLNKVGPILNQLRESYDYLVINLTEIGEYIDAALIGKHTDGTIIFLTENHSLRKQLTDCVEQLSYAGAPILGFAVAK